MFDHNQESMNTHESDVKSEDSIHKNQKSLNYRKNEPMKCLKKTYNYPKWQPKLKLMEELKKMFDQN